MELVVTNNLTLPESISASNVGSGTVPEPTVTSPNCVKEAEVPLCTTKASVVANVESSESLTDIIYFAALKVDVENWSVAVVPAVANVVVVETTVIIELTVTEVIPLAEPVRLLAFV